MPVPPDDLAVVGVLPDGTTVPVRPIRPDDVERLARLFPRLSNESIYRRFLTPIPRPSRLLLAQLVRVDAVDHLALVAMAGDEIVGVVRYDRLPGEARDADAAVLVEDAWQRRGLGRLLLERLAQAAVARGVRAFVAEVLSENRPMLALLGVLGSTVTMKPDGPTTQVRVNLDHWRQPGAGAVSASSRSARSVRLPT